MAYINNVPPRIKYYLLEYLDAHKHTIHAEMDYKSLNTMSKDEVQKLFRMATAADLEKYFPNGKKIQNSEETD